MPPLPPLIAVRVDPLVVFGQSGTFRLAARLQGSGVDRVVRIDLGLRISLAVVTEQGREVTSIGLADDGGPGDGVAGDGVYTSAPLGLIPVTPRPVSEVLVAIQSVTYHHPPSDQGDVVTTTVPLGPDDWIVLGLYLADPAIVEIPPIEESDGNGFARTARVTLLVMSPPPDSFFTWLPRVSDVARRYYAYGLHDPDFLVVGHLPGKRNRLPLHLAGAFLVRNQVAGIGVDPHDVGSTYGSPGRLQSAAIFRFLPGVRDFRVMIHELLHRWAVSLDPILGVREEDGGAHWSGLNRSFTGFEDQRFNDVELYLMGLLPADSVNPPELRADGTVTLQDLIAVHGERRPAWPDAQREFTLSLVVVYDRLLSAAEMAVLEFWMQEFEQPVSAHYPWTFQQATGGRATVSTGPGS